MFSRTKKRFHGMRKLNSVGRVCECERKQPDWDMCQTRRYTRNKPSLAF